MRFLPQYYIFTECFTKYSQLREQVKAKKLLTKAVRCGIIYHSYTKPIVRVPQLLRDNAADGVQ